LRRPLPDFSKKQREFKDKYREKDGKLPNFDLLMILEDIIWEALQSVPTTILLDPDKYTIVNFVIDWLDAYSLGRTSNHKRPFKKRKHGIVIDTPTKEVIITIRLRDKTPCPHCRYGLDGKHSKHACDREFEHTAEDTWPDNPEEFT
jgi:hypothetical protein